MNTFAFTGKTALVTGAAGGIGRAVVLRLARAGAEVFPLGRSPERLAALARDSAPAGAGPPLHPIACDLADDDAVAALRSRVPRLDILVHSAGFIRMAALESAPIADFDRHYRINARAPLLLTQALLPLLRAARGQIVFVNSSIGVRVKARAGAYAASKHALKAIADTLRMELNPSGVRVISVFPGNTATGMQEQLCRVQGRPYDPHAMLQPDDVATAVIDALRLPESAEVTDIHIRPARKASA